MNEFDINNFINELSKIERTLNTVVIENIKDNDLCVCGSNLSYSSCYKGNVSNVFQKYQQVYMTKGKAYTNCAINKSIEEYIEHNKRKKNPSNRVYHKSLEKKNVKLCLANSDYGACDDFIVYAHTISRNPILTKLSSNNKLVTFNRHVSFPKKYIAITMKR